MCGLQGYLLTVEAARFVTALFVFFLPLVHALRSRLDDS